jgi:hypothetical protein
MGVELRQGHLALALEGSNLLNSRGDSFAYGNPLRILASRQYIRQDPFRVKLSLTLLP